MPFPASTRVLPIDQNGFAIQALAYGRNATLSYDGNTSRTQIPTLAAGVEDVYRLAAPTACYVMWGDSQVKATSDSVLFPGGVEITKIPQGATHLAVLQYTDPGTLSITEMV